MKIRSSLSIILCCMPLMAWVPDTLSECDLTETIVGFCDSTAVSGTHTLTGDIGTIEFWVYARYDPMYTATATVGFTSSSYATLRFVFKQYVAATGPILYVSDYLYSQKLICELAYDIWITVKFAVDYDNITVTVNESSYVIGPEFGNGNYASFFGDGVQSVSFEKTEDILFLRAIVGELNVSTYVSQTEIFQNTEEIFPKYDLSGRIIRGAVNYKEPYFEIRPDGRSHIVYKRFRF